MSLQLLRVLRFAYHQELQSHSLYAIGYKIIDQVSKQDTLNT